MHVGMPQQSCTTLCCDVAFLGSWVRNSYVTLRVQELTHGCLMHLVIRLTLIEVHPPGAVLGAQDPELSSDFNNSHFNVGCQQEAVGETYRGERNGTE